jgi:2-iminobutanoate/2-iminopropanoate deaminase
MIEAIQSDKSAAPIGPYSQAIRAGGFVFVAGEKGLDVKTGKIVPGGMAAETRQTLENIKGILEEAGSSMDRVVQSFVYMTDLSEFQAMNEVYAEYFTATPPGRTTVEVKALPAGAQIEITVTALA